MKKTNKKVYRFVDFIKYHYNYTLAWFPDETSYRFTVITKRERPFIIVLAYILILFSPLVLLIGQDSIFIKTIIVNIITGLCFLSLGQFSIIYYHYFFMFYKRKDNSVNRQIIVNYYYNENKSLNWLPSYKKKYTLSIVKSRINKLVLCFKEKDSGCIHHLLIRNDFLQFDEDKIQISGLNMKNVTEILFKLLYD